MTDARNREPSFRREILACQLMLGHKGHGLIKTVRIVILVALGYFLVRILS